MRRAGVERRQLARGLERESHLTSAGQIVNSPKQPRQPGVVVLPFRLLLPEMAHFYAWGDVSWSIDLPSTVHLPECVVW